MLVKLQSVLRKAQMGNYAVGAFNINNMEIAQSVVHGAVSQKAPVILQTWQGAIEYAGVPYLKAIADAAAKEPIPVVLHLDHGRDLDTIKKCIKLGWTGIMYDGSHLPFKDNVRNTSRIVKWAHKKGVGVEGELGTIGGAEDAVSAREIIYTDIEKAKEFVDLTGVDALAVAIGTSHGAYKFEGSGRLDIHLLKCLRDCCKVPLVLHGASGIPAWLVTLAARYGAELGRPEGVPNDQIALAVKNGICKVNTDTDLRLAFDASVRKTVLEHPEDFDPRHILGPARELMQKIVEERIQLFGSAGKAK